MNITDLIVELLEKGQKVVMPGIGTLDTVQRAAHHDPATRTYYPAGRAIAFSEASDEECDIVKVLAERECINEEVAKQMWLNYIDALTDKVKHSGHHTFGRLGALTCDDKRTFGFKMTEGLVLDADSKGEMPIEEVKIYNHEGEEDPFARFDDEEVPTQETPAPEPVAAPAPEAEPAHEPTPEPTPEPVHVAEPEPINDEESHWDESLKKLEKLNIGKPVSDPKAEERAEKERLKAEKKAEEERRKLEKKAAEQQRYEEEMRENQRKEAEKREAEEKRKAAEEMRKAEERAEKERIKAEKEAEYSRRKAEKEAAKADAKSEKERIKAEKKAAALAAMAARDNAKAEAATSSIESAKQSSRVRKHSNDDNGKKRRVWPILLIVLVLLLLCGGAAYYLLNRNKTAVRANTTATVSHLDVPAVTPLTYNPDMINYTSREIAENGDMVCLFMQDYINSYLADRGFSSARVPMMDRIRQYANERLEQMLGERFAVQRLLSYNDYIYNYNEPFLKYRYARSCRGKVQSELMNYRALDDMLYRLADELGLQPSAGGQKSAAEVQQVKADEQKTIERRKQTPPPTDAPQYVYVEKSSKQGFDLIAGFYLNKNTAAKMTARLHDMGCDAYIIEYNDMYYVSMGSANSQTAAEALYKHVKSWYEGDVVIKKW